MNRLYEILTVLLLCLVGLGLSDSFGVPVFVFLAAVVLLLLVELLNGRLVASVLIALVSLSCVWVPLMFCMLPLLVYCAMQVGRWYLAIPALAVFGTLGNNAAFTNGADSGGIMTAISQPLTGPQYLIASVGAVIAFILFLRMTNLEEANKKLRHLRDEVAEKNDRLSAQNNRLVEAQDNEIHIATLRERNRIAREIHDNVGHMLTRSLLQVGALLVATPQDSPLHEPLEGLRDTLDLAMTNVRESVHDLHDESIDLRAVIEDCVKPAREQFTISVNYSLPDTLPPNLKLGMAGIVREAVSNAIRHSDGNTLSITACEHPGYYELTVHDNGHSAIGKDITGDGMNSDKSNIYGHPASTSKITADSSAGIGLRTMEERAQEMQGHIRLDADENGFTVTLNVPK
ncbi:MAG: sensor histidine kinase [Eubacterium sp.]|nr:sensor histidine kinase [Eubacterium sp.]